MGTEVWCYEASELKNPTHAALQAVRPQLSILLFKFLLYVNPRGIKIQFLCHG